MTLVLRIIHGPEGVAATTRRLESGSLSIGRGPRNDWVLPDPDRVLSKQHCIVIYAGDGWEITDTSSNGTFLNNEPEALGNQVSRPLRDGDRLLIGSYEINAAVQDARWDEPPTLSVFETSAKSSPGTRSGEAGERMAGDPFAPVEDDPLGISLPPDRQAAEYGTTRPDHVPAVEAEYRPPRPSSQLLPDDWDSDASVLGRASPAQAPTPEPPAPAATPDQAASAPVAPDPVRVPAGDAAQGFAAFAAGARLSGPAPADPDASLRAVGAAFRAVVAGLRQAMIARTVIKSEFRIDQTMMRAAGNNPLKFSANDDDALAGLLGLGRRTDMTAESAIDEAMRDIRLHELAMASAMRRATHDLLASVAPAEVIKRAGDAPFDQLPGRRAARLWKAYEDQHGSVAQALSDDLSGVFGRSFMRAYEQALRDAQMQAPSLPFGGSPSQSETEFKT